MNKFRKAVVSALAVIGIGCSALGITACAGDGADFPAYRKPVSYEKPGDTDEEFSGRYKVAVVSEGGLKLSDVRVEVKLNGNTVLTGISIDGEISFTADPAEYDLIVNEDTLPVGYFIGDETFKTKKDSGDAKIVVKSKVMSDTAAGNHTYAIGDVMHDFGYTDNDGNKQQLSKLLSENSPYKAVVLNFWYIGCDPCKAEFPFIQEAYNAYSDKVKLIAFNTMDAQASINSFREENKYTFDMVLGSDIAQLFSVSATPTTVIIDRYGVYVFRDSGSRPDARWWMSTFSQFVSDDYSQNPSDSNTPGGDSTDVEIVKPNIPEGDYDEIEKAICGVGTEGKILGVAGATTEKDKVYNWPWLLATDENTGRKYVKTTNSTYGNSYSILSMNITLEEGDYISYDYYTETEATQDVFYVLVNGQLAQKYSGSTKTAENNDGGWVHHRAMYMTNRNKDIQLAFCYQKDALKNEGADYVGISNLTIENVKNATEAIDILTYACSGEFTADNKQYTDYVKPYFNEDDNYFHVKYGDGSDSILFLDMKEPTAFSDLHIGSDTFTPLSYEKAQKASFYNLVYWDYTNWKDRSGKDDPPPLTLTIGGDRAEKLTEIFLESYYSNEFSPTKVIPVSKDVREIIETYAKEYCRVENISYYENIWLEFCYYFKHYGPEHAKGEDCSATTDPVPGMSFINAYTAKLGKNEVNIWNINTNDGGGMIYKFKPDKTGVYRFYSETVNQGDDPLMTIYDAEGKVLKTFDNLVRYNLFLNGRMDLQNFDDYIELENGKEYYFRIRKGFQTTGKTVVNIEYTGESYDFLRVASLGDGVWTYNLDTGISYAYYLAVDVKLNTTDNCYYHVKPNGELGSKIYIDFIHPNFYEENDHSLIWIVEEGLFDFTELGGGDLTPVMKQYYKRSIDGKDESDELYGMIEATNDLVNNLSKFILVRNNEKLQTGFWLAFACYYEHYGK